MVVFCLLGRGESRAVLPFLSTNASPRSEFLLICAARLALYRNFIPRNSLCKKSHNKHHSNWNFANHLCVSFIHENDAAAALNVTYRPGGES